MKAFINDRQVDFSEGETILEVARRNKIFIPTLCALTPINHLPGTCRVCLVEIRGGAVGDTTKIATSCNTPLSEGMHVQTRTPEVRRMQRQQSAWLFADHDQDCASCARHGNCELQDLALYVGLKHNPCDGRFLEKRPIDETAPGLVMDPSKCIRCTHCVDICRKVQGVSALTLDDVGTCCRVGIAGAKNWGDSPKCVSCGQCVLVCPTGALAEKNQTETALDWFGDPEIKTVVAFAPAVRVSLGDEYGLAPGKNLEKQIITAIRMLGADFVCDINWGADVTIMEEGAEFLHRFETKQGKLPMMTSCCPGWVNFVEKVHPEFMGNLSSTRSPQGCIASLAKTYLAKNYHIAPEKLRFISIMPCTAKKDEAGRSQLTHDGLPDTDLVLTVREFYNLLLRMGISVPDLEPSEFDSPFMAENSGAGAIFGVTGGVMEAALRTVYHTATGQELGAIEYHGVRGFEAVRSSEVDLGPAGKARVAVVHGLANAEELLQRVKDGLDNYDFIEVMACPGGCIGGGGNPRAKANYQPNTVAREEKIYKIDRSRKYRQSHNNPDVIRLYKDFLRQPNSELAEENLHTHFTDRSHTAPIRNVQQLWKTIKLY